MIHNPSWDYVVYQMLIDKKVFREPFVGEADLLASIGLVNH